LPGGLAKLLASPETSFTYAEAPSVYAQGAAYPGGLAELTGDGILRQQRVVGIAAFPVQYDPKTLELTVYESLEITVTFQGSSAINNKTSLTDSPAYENFLKGELLNYESAREFRQAVSSDLTQLNMDGQGSGAQAAAVSWAPPEPGWRVRVQQDGFYELTYDELNVVGFLDSNPDPTTFQLYHMGQEVAIQVPGEDDGDFDLTDTIRFFGEGADSKYSKDSVYWLTYDPLGEKQGKRMPSRDGPPGAATTPDYYSASRHMENNAVYLSRAI